jgi:phosphinothricin acetyltransferase
MMIREAKIEDLDALLAIYNDGIMTGTASFEERPLTKAEGIRWFNSHQDRFLLLIFEEEFNILGYVTISPFGHPQETAYNCVELSIYIHKMARGKGVGSQLMDAMIERVKKDEGIKAIISVITEGNEGSVYLHEKKGFVYGGKLSNVAQKYGQILNILYYQKTL